MFYVYEWFDTDTSEIFYVGKGCKNRYKQTQKRNKLFQQYLREHNCDSRILKWFDNELDAFNFEHERIIELKSKNLCRCNLDYGGKGGVNFVWTNEMKNYMSEHNPMKNPTQRARMSKNNPMKDKEIASKVGRKRCRAVIINGEYYHSTKEAAECLGVKHSQQIQIWCKRGYDRDKNPCKYADEEYKPLDIKITCSKPLIVDGIFFNSVSDAAKVFNTWPETIIRAIKQNRPFKGHTCAYANQQPSQTNFDNSSLEGSTTNG